MTDIDPYPVAELPSRYKLGKQAVYNRLEALQIKPHRQGNRSYIGLEQLQALDQLEEHLVSGGTMGDFNSPPLESSLSPVDTVDLSTGLNRTDDLITLIERIATAVKPLSDPLAHLEQLEKAVANNWLLSTKEVQRVIGVKPKGEKFTRGSFTFVRSGKIGNQSAWRVVKSL
ncbi:MAG: hypothetical protein F6J89_06395 [Symploca sp. SIO1C4]|uniref:Uncharacterized protein n=1 Tax=Symploca sp. SIO1C4 TaxID=2607765 RepID=A0A6B3N6R2_9CYAN|nr:hypothetical protein [Symploca sp. SIO1C4]